MKNIAIFASGKGSNANSIINYFRNHKNICVKVIITNNAKADIIHISNEEKIDYFVFNKALFLSGEKILECLVRHNISFIALAGFLLKIPQNIINKYENSILNIHPAILPEFGGKGMYGLNVHRSVLKAKKKYSGISIHYVNSEYDKGGVVFQAKCNVFKNDTTKLLAKRVQKLEHKFFPIIIENIINNGN